MIKVSVIIVLYNEYEKLKKTLESVYENKIPKMEIIIIDNSPKTDKYEPTRKLFPKVIYIQSKKNHGFAGGVNEGIKIAKGDFFLVITPDMYLLPNTLGQTFEFIETHPRVGILGSKVFSSPGIQEPSILSTYPNLFTQLFYYNMPFYKLLHRFVKNYQPMYLSQHMHQTVEVKAISGQYILIRREAISQVNFFDTRFFLYFEDIDLCKRLYERNWKVMYLHKGGVVQNGVTSWKKTKITQSYPVYMESNYKFFLKHYGKVYTMLAWIIGAFSATVSIPYLIMVMYTKKFFYITSQAEDLITPWKEIVKWHFIKGLKLILR